MPVVIGRDLVVEGRARADHAHVAAQDVEELRQLVQAPLAQKAADSSDTVVVGDLVDGGAVRVHTGLLAALG